jgi:predicted TIM-barrel fold metal-dependent hydrolase
MKVIDIHTHPIFESNDSRDYVDRIVAFGRRFGYERMVALGDVLRYGNHPTEQQIRTINDWTMRVIDWYPDVFIGFCYLNPLLGAAAVRREMKRCIQEHGFRGVKLEICNNATHPAMAPVMEEAIQLNVPVLQHSADMTKLKAREFHSDPADTAELGRRYPDARIIMAHLTACDVRGVLEIADVPNVCVDTSAYLPFSGLVELAVEKLGADRVVYGSDLPIRDLPSTMGRILDASISETARESILYTNAAHLLGLN